MKRIILTEEQKIKYEQRVNAKQQTITKKRSRCPKCSRKFTIAHAEKVGHPGYCSRRCLTGIPQPKRIKTNKKRERQSNRQKNKASYGFYKTREWKELRFSILRKYGFSCMACGRKPPGIILNVDHIKPRSKYPELEMDINNLQVLCATCNVGKLHHFEDDLRPKEDFLTDAAQVGLD